MNHPTPITPPTPDDTPPGGAALPVPCLSCACGDDGYPRRRGLCHNCYQRAYSRGITAQYPACGAVSVPRADPAEIFEGFPEGYTHEPTGWPLVPALVAPLHPTLPAPDRWANVIWFRRPQHDPVGQRLFDCETRYVAQEAA